MFITLVLKEENESIDFNSIGNKLKRIAPEYLKVIFPSCVWAVANANPFRFVL